MASAAAFEISMKVSFKLPRTSEKLVVVLGQIAASFFAEGVEHVDHFAGAFEVNEWLARSRIGHSAEHGGGVTSKKVDEHLKAARGLGLFASEAIAGVARSY